MGTYLCILTPPGLEPDSALMTLAARWEQTGEALLLSCWRAALPGRQIVRVDGRSHDLWWEFALKHSFRWQGHLYGMGSATCRRRMLDLAFRFSLIPLLEQRVEDLTPAERARADLAVALLPDPDVLLWIEPFALLPAEDRPSVVKAVKSLVLTRGLTVVAASGSPGGLAGIPQAGPVARHALP